MTPSKLRVAIVGLGRLGKRHASNLAKRINHVELIAAASPQADEREWAKNHLSIPYIVENLDQVLAISEVDAVILVTPTSLHAEQSIAVLKSGKHLFVEKPLALDIAACEKVEQVAKICKRQFPKQISMVGFVRRFDASYLAARQAILAGEIGKAFFVRSQTCDQLDPNGFFIQFAPTSGGIFLDCSVHDIDLVRWLLSDIDGNTPKAQKVYATGVCAVHPELTKFHDVDNGIATIEFDNGCRAVLYASRTFAHGHETSTEIIGTQGKLLIGSGAARNRVVQSDKNGVRFTAVQDFAERFEQAFETELQTFVDACLGKVSSSLSLHDATEATRIGQMITRALHSGQVEEIDYHS